MPIPKKHAQRRIIEQVLGTPWQIMPEKMDQIVELLQLRSEGFELTEQEVTARIGSEREDSSGMTIVGDTAVIEVYGSIFQKANLLTRSSGATSTENLAALITKATADQQIKQIVLDIDSPGGAAIGTEELVRTIEKSRETKQILASVNGICASAAYYIASACDKVFASPSSMVGSIGTLIVHRESSKADEERGIKYTIFRSGQFKADGNDREPLTDQSRETINERVVAYHDLFVDAVARNRGVSEQTVRTEFGAGKMFIAQESLRRGLIDEVASLDQVIQRVSSAAPSNSVSSKENQMDKKLKAAMFARGLVESADAADEVCEVALNAWFKAKDIDRPKDDAACLEAINNPPQLAPLVSETVQLDTTTSVDPEPTREQIQAEERNRIGEIRAIAEQLGGVPEESVTNAIESGLDPNEFSRAAIAARQSAFDPVTPTTIQGVEAEIDKFNDCAVNALMSRAGIDLGSGDHQFGGLEGRTLSDVAAIAVETCTDMRLGRYPRREIVAANFLAMGGESLQVGAAGSNDPAFHGSGSFPNLLSVLANKMLDRAMEYAPATYSMWTNRLPDVPDFKPATIASAGEFNHLPQHALGRVFDHSDFDEGVSWIQIEEYGNEFVLTPDMIVNDDLDAFTQAMNTRGIAHELTLNKLVIDHLISDPRTADGLPMFDPSHGNDITSGGAPDSSQLSEHRKAHRRQVGISKKNKLRYEPAIVLVSPEWETQAEQTLQAVIYPQSDIAANNSPPNTFRGRYRAVVEPMLDDVADNKVWYTIVDPMLLRGMVHAFQSGYGQGGRRRSYFHEPTQCRHFQLAGRFATSAVNSQAIVRNNGS